MRNLKLALPVVLLVLAVSLLPACGTAEPTIPPGPPGLTKFELQKNTLQQGESPIFYFEGSGAGRFTVRQNGEVVFEGEVTIADTEGESRQSLDNVAYALPLDGRQTGHPHPAGIYPVEFNGASCGEPAKIIWDFGDEAAIGDTGTGFLELELVSGDCQRLIESVQFQVKPAEPEDEWWHVDADRLDELPTFPNKECPEGLGYIKSFSVDNERIEVGKQPRFSFVLAPVRGFMIRQGTGDMKDADTICWMTFPPNGGMYQDGIMKLPLGNVAYALPADGTQPDHLRAAGIYPVIYKGATSGKPAYVVFAPDQPLCKPEGPCYCPSGPCDSHVELWAWSDQCLEKKQITVKYEVPEEWLKSSSEPSLGSVPEVNCSLSSLSVPSGGGEVTLYWDSKGADTVMLTVGSGEPSQIPPSGSLKLNVTKATCCTITGENEAGTSEKECCVSVQAYQPPEPTPTPPPDDQAGPSDGDTWTPDRH